MLQTATHSRVTRYARELFGGKYFEENTQFQSKFDGLIVKACSLFTRGFSLMTSSFLHFFLIYSSAVRVSEH